MIWDSELVYELHNHARTSYVIWSHNDIRGKSLALPLLNVTGHRGDASRVRYASSSPSLSKVGLFFEPTLGNCTNLVSGESMILISFIDYVQLGSITLLALILHHWNLATWTLIQCRVLYSLTSLCFKENEFWNANSSRLKNLKFWWRWVSILDENNVFGWRKMSFKLMDFEVHLASSFPMKLAMLNHVVAQTNPPYLIWLKNTKIWWGGHLVTKWDILKRKVIVLKMQTHHHNSIKERGSCRHLWPRDASSSNIETTF